MNLKDEEPSGLLKHVTVPEMVEKIHGVVLRNRKVEVGKIAKAVSFSAERVHHILYIKLGMSELSA